jgi:GH43 family beta-xylosidase
MRNRVAAIVIVLLGTGCLNSLLASDGLLKTRDIRVRDPFIYADAGTKTYYLYAQSGNRENSGYKGVEVYASKDLERWLSPQTVLSLPDDADVIGVWAPEVHEYNGAFYLFVTLTYRRTLSEKRPVDTDRWPAMHVRGTHIFRADQPTGPFTRLKITSHTPEDWMALDGTLFVEDGTPYMVFCHEWVQVIDGTMDVVRLKDDLFGTVGKPEVLFRASDAPGAITERTAGKVTDGCFLYRSPKSRKLFMIWSTFIRGSGYCVVLTESQSGKIGGPWINQKPIYGENGGHGMLFRSFDGRLMMALHQPNSGGKERLHLFEVADNGETLEIKEEVTLETLPR